MTTNYAGSLEKGGGKLKKLLAVSATALIASAMLAMPAWAAVNTPHSVTVFPDRDMVGVEGYTDLGLDQPMTVEVFRNGVQIGTASGDTINTAGGPGLEVNHGPAGAAQPGDCWEGVTPDILPGDLVRVTTADGVEDTEVRNVSIDSVTDGAGSVVTVQGSAIAPGGGQLPLAELAEEVRHIGPVYRSEPNQLNYDSPTATTWTATYTAPYLEVKDDPAFTDAQRKQFILDGGHAIVWSNAAATETTISEFGEPGGPAPGCDAPRSANAVTSLDDEFVNINSGDLAIGGTAIAATTSVSVSISDEAGNTVTRDVAAADLQDAGAAGKTWTVTVPRGDIHPALQDGALTISGTYTDGGGTGATKTIQKDTVAPGRPTATPGGGRYERSQRVTLDVENGAKAHYTVNGSLPTASSRTFGSPIPVTATQTIRSIAVDGVGNPSQVAGFRYTILRSSFVSLNLRFNNIKLGQKELIKGRVAPAHPGKRVKITINRPGKDLVRNVKLKGNSTYSYSYKPNRVGRHAVKVRFAGDADHSASNSP
ncbi:MAG: chitobiase/beta-hexosaminidase C-terminal domain-containing protein, partial [Rubrobacteraceae bacterium]